MRGEGEGTNSASTLDPQGMSAYSTSKAGVIGLAKAAGKEYAETGVTVNALAPAVIRTGKSWKEELATG